MAKSNADICNQALIEHLSVRGVQINDLAADQTEEAAVMNALFEDARDACLAAFPWPFATLRKTLNLIDPAQEPARDGWKYIYALPGDCLEPRRIWQLGDSTRALRSDQRIPFAVEKASTDDSQVLLCDTVNAVLLYTARVTDPTKFPTLFGEALSALLGIKAAGAITGKEAKKAAAQVAYRSALGEARVAALAGVQEDQAPETESIAGRK